MRVHYLFCVSTKGKCAQRDEIIEGKLDYASLLFVATPSSMCVLLGESSLYNISATADHSRLQYSSISGVLDG